MSGKIDTNSKKKTEGRFNIYLCLADPRHKKAADALNGAGRRKAYLVADAICYYLERNGEYGEYSECRDVGDGYKGHEAVAYASHSATSAISTTSHSATSAISTTSAAPDIPSPPANINLSPIIVSDSVHTPTLTPTPISTYATIELDKPTEMTTVPSDGMRQTILEGLSMLGGWC